MIAAGGALEREHQLSAVLADETRYRIYRSIAEQPLLLEGLQGGHGLGSEEAVDALAAELEPEPVQAGLNVGDLLAAICQLERAHDDQLPSGVTRRPSV